MASKKIVFVIAQKNFRDEELFEPIEVLRKWGVETKIAAPKQQAAIGKMGGSIVPDLTTNQISLDDFDGIVMVGGSGAGVYLEDEQIHELLRQFRKAGKIVAGICLGPVILANAGILMGKKATAYAGGEEDLRSKGAEYTGMAVEVDGNIITGRGPDAAREFGEKLVWKLNA